MGNFKWIGLAIFLTFICAYAEKDEKQIKADTICIGEDCRSKWPGLKCANYDGRPAGETGDEFCSRMNKTCVAVSIG